MFYLYADSAGGYVCEKNSASSTQVIPKSNEGEATSTDFGDGQHSKASPSSVYHPTSRMTLSRNEQGIVGGQFNPHGAVHFISPQVSVCTRRSL